MSKEKEHVQQASPGLPHLRTEEEAATGQVESKVEPLSPFPHPWCLQKVEALKNCPWKDPSRSFLSNLVFIKNCYK